MNYKRLCILNCFLLLVSLSQAQLYKINIDEKYNNASVITEGTVLAQHSFWNSTHTMIYTSNTLQVHKIFKGKLEEKYFQIITQGGTVGNNSVEVSELLQLQKGDLGLFFCMPNTLGIKDPTNKNILMDVYSSVQGFLKYDEALKYASAPFAKYTIQNLYKYLQDKAEKSVTIYTPLPTPPSEIFTGTAAASISSFAPGTVYGGALNDPANNILTINGNGFGNIPSNKAAVKFKNADNDDTNPTYIVKYDDPEIISWSDNQIQVSVPSKAATGMFAVTISDGSSIKSNVALNVYYSVLSTNFSGSLFEPRMMDTDGKGGYTMQYSNSNAGTGVDITTSSLRSTFERAVKTWQEIVGVKYSFGPSIATQAVEASDDINLVVIDNANTTVPKLSQGVLAVTYSYFAKCSGSNFDAQKTGFDILIRNENFSNGAISFTDDACFPARGEYDLETVILHELGHSLNLAHVYDDADFSSGNDYNTLNPSTLMHYSIIDFSNRRTPDGSAVLAANYAISPQKNMYGNCGLSIKEMQPTGSLIATSDGCPGTFPTSATPKQTIVFIDLAHSTSNVLEDPGFKQINCNNTGVYVSNNAYYAIKTDPTPSQSLKLCISGYTTDPVEQANCSQQGVRLSLFDASRCPGGGLFSQPVFCTTFNGDGSLSSIPNLIANHNYLLYFDGLRNTKALFKLTINDTSGCAGTTVKEISIGPNPMLDELTLRFENAVGSKYEYAIYTTLGQLAISGSLNISLPTQTISIPTGRLASGVYYLRFTDQSGNITSKKLLKITR